MPDPVRCCEWLAGYPYRVFLDSSARGPRLGRYSFLAADPIAVVRSKGARTECLDLLSGETRESHGDALDVLRTILSPTERRRSRRCRPFKEGPSAFCRMTGGARSSVFRRAASTIWNCPTSSSACTTGSSRGITKHRERG